MKTSPPPLENEVHLYCISMPHDPFELSRLAPLLSSSEAARAGLLKSEGAKMRYIAGRGLLREILGGYLGVEAQDLRLETGVHGKPFLVAGEINLCFNLSHSGDIFLLAVSVNREVGVDVELIVPGKPLGDMARLVFTRNEQDALSHLSLSEREAAFYRCWVRKEACLKASGRGFSLSGDSFDISPVPEATEGVMARCNQKQWHVLDIDLPQQYCAAIAVESRCSRQLPPTVVRVEHPRYPAILSSTHSEMHR